MSEQTSPRRRLRPAGLALGLAATGALLLGGCTPTDDLLPAAGLTVPSVESTSAAPMPVPPPPVPPMPVPSMPDPSMPVPPTSIPINGASDPAPAVRDDDRDDDDDDRDDDDDDDRDDD